MGPTARTAAVFISYDGLTDPLGGSQIIPYLCSISEVVSLHVISLEKPKRFSHTGPSVRRKLEDCGIRWHPLRYSEGRGALKRLWDLIKLNLLSIFLTLRYRVMIAHCRSYIPAQVGLLLKRFFGIRLIFDMRGFWVDERVDGQIWDLNTFKGRSLYRLYKLLERRLLIESDEIVTLTSASLPVLQEWLPQKHPPVTVIPCCADFKHFSIDPTARCEMRRQLGIDKRATVLCYLGSLGTWYRLPEMLATFASLRAARNTAKFMILTGDWNSTHARLIDSLGLSRDIVIISASRDEVPRYLQAADIGISYISPSFSKIASSPTKIAEYLAVGLPIISNAGVGDVEAQVSELQAGIIKHQVNLDSLITLAEIQELEAISREELRERASSLLSLENATASYRLLYHRVLATIKGRPGTSS